jgi:hypothetical protein
MELVSRWSAAVRWKAKCTTVWETWPTTLCIAQVCGFERGVTADVLLYDQKWSSAYIRDISLQIKKIHYHWLIDDL